MHFLNRNLSVWSFNHRASWNTVIDGPVTPFGRFIRRKLQAAPYVTDKAVLVVHALDVAFVSGSRKQHRAAAKKRLDVMLRVAECSPNFGGYFGFAAKIRKRCFKCFAGW